jgi:hypothetical protein
MADKHASIQGKNRRQRQLSCGAQLSPFCAVVISVQRPPLPVVKLPVLKQSTISRRLVEVYLSEQYKICDLKIAQIKYDQGSCHATSQALWSVQRRVP